MEQVSTEILKSVLIRIKKNPKTLGNQGSSLSFKTKIDLLYDLDDISKEEYSRFINFMEVRNQFAHNAHCNSFKSLSKIKEGAAKFILKQYPSEIKEQLSDEENLQACYSKMAGILIGKLLVLEIEYSKGLKRNFIRSVNAQIMEDIDTIWQCAIADYNEKYQFNLNPKIALLQAEPINIDTLLMHFKLCIARKGMEITESLTEDPEGINKLFSQKVDLINQNEESTSTEGETL